MRNTGLRRSRRVLFSIGLFAAVGVVAVAGLFAFSPWSSSADSTGSQVETTTVAPEGLTGVEGSDDAAVSGAPQQLAGEPFRTCEVCHADFLRKPTQAPSTDLIFSHPVHLDQEIDCVTCHNPPLGHFDTPAPMMMACLQCHQGETAPHECANCHRLIEQIAPGLDEPVVHLGTNAFDRETCVKCHEVDTWCERCHGLVMPHPADWAGTHTTFALTRSDTCEKCHQSRDVTFCVRCHGVEMPHPAYWYSSHGDVAQSNEQACVRCHPTSPQFCNQCHHAGFSPTAAWADGQHGEAVGRQGSGMCLVCHDEQFCERCHDAGRFVRP